VTNQPKWVKWAFLATAILLPIGWLVAVIVSWDHIVDSHARLGYLIGDVGIVTAGGARLRPRPLRRVPDPGELHRRRLGMGHPLRRPRGAALLAGVARAAG
jgi:hypothetical protein